MNVPTWRSYVLWVLLLLSIQAGLLLLLAREVICTCGYIKFWEGNVLSMGNSQHLLDWYSFTHIIHGFFFYLLVWLLAPKMPVLKRLLVALSIEAGWEVIENTPYVIDLYRQQALSQGYIGDTIVNSVSDSIASVAGFVLASKFPVWTVVMIAIAIEVILAMAIRDNLTFNVINFIHPIEQIVRWQSGAM